MQMNSTISVTSPVKDINTIIMNDDNRPIVSPSYNDLCFSYSTIVYNVYLLIERNINENIKWKEGQYWDL